MDMGGMDFSKLGGMGKILSLPEFCSPVDSPKLIPAHSNLSQTTEKPEILQCSSDTNDLIDEDSDKDDDALFTIDVSVPKDYVKESENIDKEEKQREIEPLPENVDGDVIEFCEEDVEKGDVQPRTFTIFSSRISSKVD